MNAAGNLAGLVVYLTWGMAPQKVTEPVVEVEFDIPLVPPGTYTATAWHPRLGTQEKLVSVLAGRHTEIDFEFGPGDLRR